MESKMVQVGHLQCMVVRLDCHADTRGYLVPVVQESSLCTQVYYSYTLSGAARDKDKWHMHRVQTDRFIILDGGAIFALSDGAEIVHVACWPEHTMLVVPPGVYHCFKAAHHGGVLLLNVPTHLYDPEDELRIPFSDLEAGNPWQ